MIYLKGDGGWGSYPSEELVERAGLAFYNLSAVKYVLVRAGGPGNEYKWMFRNGNMWDTKYLSYPSAKERIEGLNSERSGDIILLANYDDGYYFDANPVKGEHGNLNDEDTYTPLIFSHPQLAGCNFGHARNIDIAPTIAHLMGFEMPGADGKPLFDFSDCMKYVPGEEVELSAVVENTGSAAGDFKVSFTIDGNESASLAVDSVPGFSSKSVSTPWTAQLGVHEVCVTVDTEDTVDESDEEDNWACRKLVVEATTTAGSREENYSLVVKHTNEFRYSSGCVEDPYAGPDAPAVLAGEGISTPHSIGRFLEFTAEDDFNEATIRLYYDESLLDVPEETLKMHLWDEGLRQWMELTITGVNTVENYVWGVTDHNSIYTAIGENLADLRLDAVISRNETVEGGVILMKVDVTNKGTLDAGEFMVKAYGIIDGETVEDLWIQTIPWLGVNQTTSMIIEYDTHGKMGYTDILVIADEEDSQKEIEEADNYAALHLTVNPATEAEYGLVKEFTGGAEIEGIEYQSPGSANLAFEVPGGSEALYTGLQVQAGREVLDNPLTFTVDRTYRTNTLDDCETLEGWSSYDNDRLFEDSDCISGHCLRFEPLTLQYPGLWKKYDTPVDAVVGEAGGYLVFWLWVNDPAYFDLAKGSQVMISSSGGENEDKYTYREFLKKTSLHAGWNRVMIPLTGMEGDGAPDLSNINFFKIWWRDYPELIVKLDDVHFESDDYVDIPFEKPLGHRTESIYKADAGCSSREYKPYYSEISNVTVSIVGEQCSEMTKCVNHDVLADNTIHMEVCRGGAGSGSCDAMGCGTNTVFDITYELPGNRMPSSWIKGLWTLEDCIEKEDGTRVTRKNLSSDIREDEMYFGFDLRKVDLQRVKKAVLHVPVRSIETRGNRNNLLEIVSKKECATCYNTVTGCSETEIADYRYDQDIEVDVLQNLFGRDEVTFKISALGDDSGTVYYDWPYIEYELVERVVGPEVLLDGNRIWGTEVLYEGEAFLVDDFEDAVGDYASLECGSGVCSVPLEFRTQSGGNLTVSNLTVVYRKETVNLQSGPEACGHRGFCEECVMQPYAGGEECAWITPTGICVDEGAYSLAQGEEENTVCSSTPVTTTTTVTTSTTLPVVDLDGDGYSEGEDCDDSNPLVHPESDEECNNLDDNCNGVADEGLTFDDDSDGYTSMGSCTGARNDCDDSNFNVKPGMTEACGNGLDDDCDGSARPCVYDLCHDGGLLSTGFGEEIPICGGT
ncbi:MAG: CARDB domain-containing protein [Candidatus Altiarchaeota archaeon]